MNDPKPQPKRRGQAVRVIAGTDAGRTATIIQEPLPGSALLTIQFSGGRAVVLPAAHTKPEQDGE